MSRIKLIALSAGTLVAGALLATGITGIANAADATPSPGQSATEHRHMGPGGPGRPHEGPRDRPIHSEAVVKAADGTYTTVSSIHGTVTAKTSTSITVKAEDGFSATYAISSTTEGAEVKIGDVVSVRGTGSGTTATATHIHAVPNTTTS